MVVEVMMAKFDIEIKECLGEESERGRNAWCWFKKGGRELHDGKLTLTAVSCVCQRCCC